jgi:uncharacterized membrane protein YccC
MPPGDRPRSEVLRTGALECCLLALACLASYALVVRLSSLVSWVGSTDHVVGGVWAVISTIIVSKNSYEQTNAAAVSRVYGTLVSMILCLIYLIFFPFHVWGLALLIGLSAFVTVLIGRPGDAAAAAIATAVLIGLAQLDPHEAWRQPIIRLADTIIGAAVGLAAAWIGLRVLRLDPTLALDKDRARAGRDA